MCVFGGGEVNVMENGSEEVCLLEGEEKQETINPTLEKKLKLEEEERGRRAKGGAGGVKEIDRL